MRLVAVVNDILICVFVSNFPGIKLEKFTVAVLNASCYLLVGNLKIFIILYKKIEKEAN